MNKLKLLASLCTCVLISFFPIIFSMRTVVSDNYKQIIRGLPAKRDFDHYLKAVENAVDFCMRHKLYVDLNMEFGMFMISVNLKSYVQGQGYNIPAKRRYRLEQVISKVDVLTDYFHCMVQQKEVKDKKYNQDMAITKLFYNATTWPRPPDKFNIDLLNRTRFYSPTMLKKIYGKWKDYYNRVNDFEEIKPTPKDSDACIKLLGRTPLSRLSADCQTSLRCTKMLQEGNEFGYGLSHRLLFMVIARFSRKCIVFSDKVDKLKADKYCLRSYSEAQFIALNDFQLPDLMYEHITLCGLFGHAQFFRNSWLQRLLQFQTSEGCFSDKIATGELDRNQMGEGDDDEWKITNLKDIMIATVDFVANQIKDDDNREWEIERSVDIMNGHCNGHFTAVAAATFSSALRYIIETYY